MSLIAPWISKILLIDLKKMIAQYIHDACALPIPDINTMLNHQHLLQSIILFSRAIYFVTWKYCGSSGIVNNDLDKRKPQSARCVHGKAMQ